jgi:hypothetical protein
MADMEGHVGAIRALIQFRADINTVSNDNFFTLSVAVICDQVDASIFLVNMGVDVKHCLQKLANHPRADPIREMVTQLWDIAGLVNSGGESNEEEENAKCAMFSLTKLMSSVLLDEGSHNVDGGDDVDECKLLLETNIARSMRHLLSNAVLERVDGMRFVLKRRLVRIAWRVYQSSLLLDGDRVTESVKARRYLEVVCLLFDLSMLGDVAALRMTCKSNNERRRFPVVSRSFTYQELEANLIEEWVGYGSSRFVSTDIIHAVLAIHNTYL